MVGGVVAKGEEASREKIKAIPHACTSNVFFFFFF
jgi:hypothetical protein